MKVLAVKGVEEFGNLWAVRYTRLTRREVQRNTQEEAREKYHELLHILTHHDGVYLSKKAKRKLKTSRREPAK